MAKGYEPAAVVVQAQGGLDIKPDGTDCWFTGDVGTGLFEGDMVWTGEGSSIYVLFSEGATLNVSGACNLHLAESEETVSRLEVVRGDAWYRGGVDERRVEVVSPVANASVADGTGSSLGIRVETGGKTVLAVARGAALFGNDTGEVRVTSNQESTCSQGQPPTLPVGVDSRASPLAALKFPFFVDQYLQPYFSSEGSRDKVMEDAEHQLDIDTADAWAQVNLGRVKLDLGDLPGAADAFNKALEVDPQFCQALCGLGKTALMKRDWQEAGGYYTRARRADRGEISGVMGMGYAALGAGNLTEAERWFKEAYDMDPHDERVLVGLGLVKLLEQDRAGALSDFEVAVSKSMGETRAYENLAIVYSLDGESALARKYFKKAVDAYPQDYRTWNSLGNYYLRRGEHEECIACYKSMQDSERPEVMAAGYQCLGVVDQYRSRISKALDDYGKSRDLDERHLPAVIDQAQARLRLGEAPPALDVLGYASDIDPGNWLPHQWSARAYLEIDSPTSVETESNESVSLNPLDWVSHVVLGIALADIAGGSNPRATEQMEKGRELAPPTLSPSEHVLVGLSYQKQGKYERALEEFQHALELSTEDEEYRRYLGEAYAAMGKNELAEEQFRLALEHAPGDVASRAAIASLLHSGGDADAAIEELERGLEQAPDSPELGMMLADYKMSEGDLEGAMDSVDGAIAIGGLAPETLAGLLVLKGNILDAMQDFHAAISEYSLALANDPSRGDAWFYKARDLERVGNLPEAVSAYQMAFELCRSRDEWKSFYAEAAQKLGELR